MGPEAWLPWADKAYFGTAIIAAVAIALNVVAGIAQNRLNARISQNKDRAFAEFRLSSENRAKELQQQTAAAQAESQRAGEAAAKAQERAAQLEKEAAEARLETEKIKQAVTWRTIPAQVAATLENALTAHPGSVNIRYTDGDPESLVLAIQFSRIFSKANWRVASAALKLPGVIFGLDLPPDSSSDAQNLRNAFQAARIPLAFEPLPTMGLEFMAQSIPGAPTLIVGSKPPALP